MSHPFGDLLSQHLHRRHGLSQSKLAAGILQAPTIITAMCKGRRLTGPQARERVIAIIRWLHEQGALKSLNEANALLNAAVMAGLTHQEVESMQLKQTQAESATVHFLSANRHNNLPNALTRMVGRIHEATIVRELIKNSRLVTLTGAGGVGKTRLALQVTTELQGAFDDGVCWVDLAALSEPTLLPNAVVSALGISEGAGSSVTDSLVHFLQERHLLLILDNCEHLIDATAHLITALLQKCPRLYILCTSRELININGETIYRVPSLSYPDPNKNPSLSIEQVSHYEALELFVQSARAAQPSLALNSVNAPLITQLCQRLDGIPLAIELAAARTSMLSIEQVVDRLNDRFRLLTGGSRTALPRHKTLHALIDWSYSLLSTTERQVLRGLSVFSGGFTLASAEGVLSLDNGNTLDLLTQLVNKSMLSVEPSDTGESQYRMLETVRQYALERLREHQEDIHLRDRHLAYFLQLSEQAEPYLRATHQVFWLDKLESGINNLRTALDWALGNPERNIEAGLRLGTALMWLWHIRGYKHEGSNWLERALAIEAKMSIAQPRSPERSSIRVRALNAEASQLMYLDESKQAVVLVKESLHIQNNLESSNKRDLAFANYLLAVNEGIDIESRKQRLKESISLYEDVADDFGRAECILSLGALFFEGGDHSQARSLLEKNVELRLKIGDVDGLANLYRFLGDVALNSEGDLQRAQSLYEQSVRLFDEVRNRAFIAYPVIGLGHIAFALGQYQRAEELCRNSLTTARGVGERMFFAEAILAELYTAQGDFVQATQYLEGILAALNPKNDVLVADVHCRLGQVALSQGNYKQARNHLEKVLELGQNPVDIGESLSAQAFFGLGLLAIMEQDFDNAQQLNQRALRIFNGLQALWQIAGALNTSAIIAANQINPERATKLFGASASLYGLIRFTLAPFQRTLYDSAVAKVKAQLGAEVFAATWTEGQAIARDQAIAMALESDLLVSS